MKENILKIVNDIEDWLYHNPEGKQVQIVLSHDTAQDVVLALRKDGRYYTDRARNHVVELAGCRTCMRSKADCVDCPYGRILDFLRKD